MIHTGASKRNAEGYKDPTAFGALCSIDKDAPANPKPATTFRPLVYICSPYAGNTERNTRKAIQYCQFAIREGAIPVASHLLYPQMLDESKPEDRELGTFFGLVLLTRCFECWVFGLNITPGMEQEIAKAKRRGMPVRYFTEDLREIK